MRFGRPDEHSRGAFLNLFTLGPGFRKLRFHAMRLQDSCGRSAKTMQNICVLTKKRLRVDGPLDRIFEGNCLPINKKPLFIQMLIYCLKFLRSQEGGSRPFLITFCFPVLPRGQRETGPNQTTDNTGTECGTRSHHLTHKDLHFRRPC